MIHLNAVPAPKRCPTCNMPLWMSEKEKRRQLIDQAVRQVRYDWLHTAGLKNQSMYRHGLFKLRDSWLLAKDIRAEFRRLSEASLSP